MTICREAGSRIADSVVEQLFSQVLKVCTVYLFVCLFVYLFAWLILLLRERKRSVSMYLLNINRVRSSHGNFKCHFPGLESHGI